MKRIGLVVKDLIGIPTVSDYIKSIVDQGECRFALDIGCGTHSHLTAFRTRLLTTGIDAFGPSIQASRSRGGHDFYVLADVLRDDLTSILAQLNGKPVDPVTLFGVIEHLPKRAGYELLERREALTSKYIVLERRTGSSSSVRNSATSASAIYRAGFSTTSKAMAMPSTARQARSSRRAMRRR